VSFCAGGKTFIFSHFISVSFFVSLRTSRCSLVFRAEESDLVFISTLYKSLSAVNTNERAKAA
jgi:hypothetical protein